MYMYLADKTLQIPYTRLEGGANHGCVRHHSDSEVFAGHNKTILDVRGGGESIGTLCACSGPVWKKNS